MNWRNFALPYIPPLKALRVLNHSLTILLALVMTGTLFYAFSTAEEVQLPAQSSQRMSLPKGAFTWDKNAYDNIGAPALRLNGEAPRLQLPDLRALLIYYGTNGRPDSSEQQQRLYLGLKTAVGDSSMESVALGERLYLECDGKGKYSFAPKESTTPLWVQLERSEGSERAEVLVGLTGPQGENIATPEELRQFHLEEKKMPRVRVGVWKIGEYRVDGSLLARQKARWYGQDKFLEEHGGEPYTKFAGKQRVEFGTEDKRYVVFVGLHDLLVWDDGRWKETTPGENSWGKPLMQVTRIEERVMGLEIWDPEGKSKVPLNLIRSRELWRPEVLEHELRFVGARTRTQCIVEILGERMTLRPEDWLLRNSEGWQRLDSAEAIDDYVDRKVEGELFVFEGVTRKDGQQILQAHMFSNSRAESRMIELSTQKREAVIYSKPDSEESEEDTEEYREEREAEPDFPMEEAAGKLKELMEKRGVRKLR